jgi:transcriptional regulator with XRE-family HTH domain
MIAENCYRSSPEGWKMPMVAEGTGIGKRVRELRAAAGLTQQQLAVAAGMTLSNVAQIERGKITDPRLSTLRALAAALGVPLGELAGDSPGSKKGG